MPGRTITISSRGKIGVKPFCDPPGPFLPLPTWVNAHTRPFAQCRPLGLSLRPVLLLSSLQSF